MLLHFPLFKREFLGASFGKQSVNNTVQFGLMLWEDIVCYLDYLNKILR